MRDTQHQLFAALVEKMATGEAFGENDYTPAFQNGFLVLVEGIVTDDGGSMDDEELVTFTAKSLINIIHKNADARREVLEAQAA